MIQTWFTAPKNSFNSYYYYDTDSRKLVRIRLELGRKDNGYPSIFIRRCRYIGFSNEKERFPLEKERWSINNNHIVCNGKILNNSPQEGFVVYDFSTNNNRKVHLGNKVAPNNEEKLPMDVTEDMLFRIASHYIKKDVDDSIVLCNTNASNEELSEIIKSMYNKIIVIL